MKTILIPVDFSENSIITCKYAIKMAGSNHPVVIHLLHICPDQLMIPDSSFPSGIDSDAFMNIQFIEELRKQSEQSMLQLVKKIEELFTEKKINNIQLTHHVSGGDPEWEIRNSCDELKPDIIIMGTHGTGKKGFLEGIMAEKIMDHAMVPVIAVPSETKHCSIKNIMYASNGNEKDFAKIKLLLKLFGEYPINILVAHFILDNKKEAAHNYTADLKEAFAFENLSQKVNFFVVDGEDKQGALETFVNHQNIDIIAFISHKSNIFKTLLSNKLSKKDFFKLNRPMLALHE